MKSAKDAGCKWRFLIRTQLSKAVSRPESLCAAVNKLAHPRTQRTGTRKRETVIKLNNVEKPHKDNSEKASLWGYMTYNRYWKEL